MSCVVWSKPLDVLYCLEESPEIVCGVLRKSLGCVASFVGKPRDVLYCLEKSPGSLVLFGGKPWNVLYCLEESPRMSCVVKRKDLGCLVLFG